jgi:hypothetical protein
VEQQIKELSSTRETFNDTEIDLLQHFLMRVIGGKVCRLNTMAPIRHKVLLIFSDAIVSVLSFSGNLSPEVPKLLSTISRTTFSEETPCMNDKNRTIPHKYIKNNIQLREYFIVYALR